MYSFVLSCLKRRAVVLFFFSFFPSSLGLALSWAALWRSATQSTTALRCGGAGSPQAGASSRWAQRSASLWCVCPCLWSTPSDVHPSRRPDRSTIQSAVEPEWRPRLEALRWWSRISPWRPGQGRRPLGPRCAIRRPIRRPLCRCETFPFESHQTTTSIGHLLLHCPSANTPKVNRWVFVWIDPSLF